MAKGKGEVVEFENTLPVFDDSEVSGFEGAGASTAAEDNLIPLLGVLNDLSPQVKKREPEYIEGAEAGMAFLKTVGQLWPGDAGPLWIQCAFQKAVVEWKPRVDGGGFITQYPEMPEEFAEQYTNDKGQTKVRNKENGNELVDTRYHFGLVQMPTKLWTPAVSAFSSTGHTVSKGWMSQITNQRDPGTGRLFPAWFSVWQLNTTLKKKNDDSWFAFDPQHFGWVKERALRDMGKALFQAVTAGDKVADLADDADGLGETF